MLENELNTIVKHSLEHQGGYAYKIPDTFSAEGNRSKAPFDGFAFYKGHFISWESKWLPKPMSLNLNRLQDHQLKGLKDTKAFVKDSYALFLVGVNYGNGKKRVYYFTDLDDIETRRKEKRNILKKEFDTLSNYIIIKKGEIDFSEILGF